MHGVISLVLFLVNSLSCKSDIQKWLSSIICSFENGMEIWSHWQRKNKEPYKYSMAFIFWVTQIKTSS